MGTEFEDHQVGAADRPSCRRVLLVDDHAVLRAGIRRLLDDEPDMEVVGEAADGLDAVEAAQRLKPDVAVVDLTLPGLDGVEVTRRIVTELPDTKVLVLTMHEDHAFVERAVAAGAAGYLLKRAADTDLINAIHALCAGEGFIDPGVTRAVLSNLASKQDLDHGAPHLSPREEQVLALIAWGYTSAEIADRLIISPKTVESHKARLMDKLGLRTRSELVHHAKSLGLLDTPPTHGPSTD